MNDPIGGDGGLQVWDVRVALICLFPDFGHAQRLLRVGAVLARAGCTVKAFMPSEARMLFSRYPFEIVALDETDAKAGRFLLDRQFSGSAFFQRFSSFTHHALFVSGFVASVFPQHARVLSRELSAFGPTLLICDSWHFRDLYRRMARSLGVPVAFHENGTIAYLQRPYVQAFGLTGHPEWRKRLVELLGRFATRGFKVLFLARYFRLWRRGRVARQAALQAFEVSFPAHETDPPREIDLTNGFSNLERRVEHPELQRQRTARVELDPTPLVLKVDGLSPEVQDWLAGLDDRSLIYVNFGSIVRITARFANAVHEALGTIGRPVLWSIPDRQKRLIRGIGRYEAVRFVNYVDQLELLRNDKVALVVCQAGGNTMQECAATGRPMLCLPFFADQPFNASIVSLLGIGRDLKPASATRAVLKRTLASMLVDESLAATSARFAREFNRHDGSSDLVRVLRAHVAGSPPAIGDPAQ